MSLNPDTARAVRKRLAAGQTQQQVADAIGIARSTVRRILRGDGPHAAISQEHLEPDPDPDYPGKSFRCPGCGALITDQCIACGLPPFAPASACCDLTDEELADLLGIDLRPVHRVRYDVIHARRCLLSARSIELDAIPGPTAADLATIDREMNQARGVE